MWDATPEITRAVTPCIRSYPVAVEYGLIWIFPGDETLARTTGLPVIGRLDDPTIVSLIVDETFDAHHSLVMENFCDLYHEKLHERYQPFANSVLVYHKRKPNGLEILYDTEFSRGLVLKYFLKDFRKNTKVLLDYTYPHLSLDFEGKQQLWIFMIPAGPQKTRILAIFLSEFVIPFTRMTMPRWLSGPITAMLASLYSRSFTHEDRVVLKYETESLSCYGSRYFGGSVPHTGRAN